MLGGEILIKEFQSNQAGHLFTFQDDEAIITWREVQTCGSNNCSVTVDLLRFPLESGDYAQSAEFVLYCLGLGIDYMKSASDFFRVMDSTLTYDSGKFEEKVTITRTDNYSVVVL